MKLIKVCFICLRSYPLFANKSSDYFGGAEVQISLLAKELAKDKHLDVNVINGNYDQPTIIKQGRLRLFKTRLFDFFRILKLVDADIYVERTINPKIILVYLFCRIFHKKFIYMVAHDWDLNHQIIKLADLIIVQHLQQQKSLKFHSLVMPSLIKIDKTKKSFRRKYILWVGRADEWKRPKEYINLAQRFSKEEFVMICRLGKNKKLFQAVKKLAESLSNLIFLTSVPYEEISDYFSQAKILVNTSAAEGFPNTFLQAGVTKTPVLSFKINPDNYINKYCCGRVGKQWFKSLLANPQELKKMGQAHYQYVKIHHNLKKLAQFKQILYKI